MSENKRKDDIDALSLNNVDDGDVAAPKKKAFYTRTWFIVTAAVTAFVLLVAMLIGIGMGVQGLTLRELFGLDEKRMDFLNDNLDKYIEIEDSDYKDYELEVCIPKPGEMDVENEILKLQAANKGGLKYNGSYMLSEPVTPGDKVYIFYTGYEINENGERVELDGTSNYSTYKDGGNGDELEIGSGSFVPGFELGLLGKIPMEYSEFKTYRSGKVQENDVVYATMSYVEESGLMYDNANVRIDLRDENVGKKWGVGILDYLREKDIGITNNDPITLSCTSGNKITITKVHVNYVTKCEEKVITVKTVFPYDYSEASFRSKTVYFDVFITRVLCYENDEFDDSFVTDKLKLTAEDLAEYEGDNLAEKYRSLVMSGLTAEYEENLLLAAEEQMWTRLKKLVNIKKLPSTEVKRIYDDYVYSYRLEYERVVESGYYDYDSLDAYIADAMGIDEGDNWEIILNAAVEDEVKEKLIFYSIIRREGLVPGEDELDAVYRAELEKDYKYYTGKDRDDFLTDSEYDKAISDYEKNVIEYYGEDFYMDTVYYNYASGKIVRMATIVNKYIEK